MSLKLNRKTYVLESTREVVRKQIEFKRHWLLSRRRRQTYGRYVYAFERALPLLNRRNHVFCYLAPARAAAFRDVRRLLVRGKFGSLVVTRGLLRYLEAYGLRLPREVTLARGGTTLLLAFDSLEELRTLWGNDEFKLHRKQGAIVPLAVVLDSAPADLASLETLFGSGSASPLESCVAQVNAVLTRWQFLLGSWHETLKAADPSQTNNPQN